MYQCSFRRDDLHRLQHALIFRQIVGDGLKNRAEAKAEGAVEWQIDSFSHLRIGAGEIDDEPVLLFAQRQYQAARTIRLHRERRAPFAVRYLAKALARYRFGLSNHLPK